MNDRPNDIKRIRPVIGKIKSFEQMGLEEEFQNNTLRPILKLQNPLLLMIFQKYIVKYKGVFYTLSKEKRVAYIENILNKDQKFRNLLLGIIIGHFTIEEYLDYTVRFSLLNKRIMNMVEERLKDQMEYFEPIQKVKL